MEVERRVSRGKQREKTGDIRSGRDINIFLYKSFLFLATPMNILHRVLVE